MADRKDQIKELTDRLEEGVREVFESGRYEEYLRVMSKFHHYSFRNILLIQIQKPDATRVAGYETWKKKFGRQVNKGEKAIKILAPAPYKTKKEMEVIDQMTHKPMKRPDGSIVTEEVEVTIPAFRVANVFDVAQTSGRPLPTLFDNIEGDVKGFERFFRAVKDISPVPIGFEQLTNSDGYYHQTEKRIALREGMSERQTAAAVIHEVAHATLHALDMDHLQESLKELGKDHRTMEVEAESIAYVVCQHYGIETGEENSFGYIAMYSKDKTLPELQASLKVIRDTASDIIGKKGMKKLVSELVLAAQGTFENDRRNSIRAFKVSGTTIKRKLYANDKKDRYFHIYYDDGRKASDRGKLEDKIDRMGRKLRELMGEPVHPGGDYKKYFDLVFWHEGLEDEKFMSGVEQAGVINREIRLCGYFVIVTSAKMTAEEALMLYKSRDSSEKTFSADKSYLGAHCERVYSNESVDTKIFIGFVATIIRSRIYTLLKDEQAKLDKKPNYMTVPAAVRELEKIEMLKGADNEYNLDYAVTATQKTILNAFGMSADNIHRQARGISTDLARIEAEAFEKQAEGGV